MYITLEEGKIRLIWELHFIFRRIKNSINFWTNEKMKKIVEILNEYNYKNESKMKTKVKSKKINKLEKILLK
jgi:hypothetical protein